MMDETDDVIYVVYGRRPEVHATRDAMIEHVFGVQEYSDDDWVDHVDVIARGGAVVQQLDPYKPPLSDWVAAKGGQHEAWVATLPRTSACIELDGISIETFTGADGLTNARTRADALRPYLGDRIVVREMLG